MESLLQAGHAAVALDAVRTAITVVNDAYGNADDSSGAIGGAAAGLADVHLAAREAVRPEPVELGDYLADRILGDADVPEFDVMDYTNLLGTTGLARVRERAAAACTTNPNSWSARLLMESLLRSSGDIDALVEFMDRGGEHPHARMQIVHELVRAGRDLDALTWAERGIREAANPDSRLLDFVTNQYATAGRLDDALTVRREAFRAQPTLAGYQSLRTAANAAGDWPAVRTWRST